MPTQFFNSRDSTSLSVFALLDFAQSCLRCRRRVLISCRRRVYVVRIQVQVLRARKPYATTRIRVAYCSERKAQTWKRQTVKAIRKKTGVVISLIRPLLRWLHQAARVSAQPVRCRCQPASQAESSTFGTRLKEWLDTELRGCVFANKEFSLLVVRGSRLCVTATCLRVAHHVRDNKPNKFR